MTLFITILGHFLKVTPAVTPLGRLLTALQINKWWSKAGAKHVTPLGRLLTALQILMSFPPGMTVSENTNKSPRVWPFYP